MLEWVEIVTKTMFSETSTCRANVLISHFLPFSCCAIEALFHCFPKTLCLNFPTYSWPITIKSSFLNGKYTRVTLTADLKKKALVYRLHVSPQFFHGKKSVAGSRRDKGGKEGIKRHSLTWVEKKKSSNQ